MISRKPALTAKRMRDALRAAREAGWARVCLILWDGTRLIADDAGEPVAREARNPWDDE